MSKKTLPHWHRIEGWSITNPSKRFAISEQFGAPGTATGNPGPRLYSNLMKAQEAAGAMNRRFKEKGFQFEACEHMPKGFTPEGVDLNGEG